MIIKNNTRNILLSGCFTLLCIVLVILYTYVRKVDESYSSLISKKVETFQILQKLTAESNKSFFVLYQILYNENALEIVNFKKQWSGIVAGNSQKLEKITNDNLLDSTERIYYYNLLLVREDGRKKCLKFLDLIEKNDRKSAEICFNTEVEPAFKSFQKQIEGFTYQNKLFSYSKSNALSSEVQKHSFWFLILGFSPVIAIVCLLFLVVIFAAVILLKGKDL